MSKSRGIIFRPWEVQAADRLSLILRVVKPQPTITLEHGGDWYCLHDHPDGAVMYHDVPHQIVHTKDADQGDRLAAIRCPFGVPGDEIWVKETWCEYKGKPYYRADGEHQKLATLEFVDQIRTEFTDAAYACQEWMPQSRWKSSTQMPLEYSRLTYTNVSDRVLRVQDVSEDDMEAMGVIALGVPTGRYTSEGDAEEQGSYRAGFCHLHDKHNPKHLWETNPWCWLGEIERKKP